MAGYARLSNQYWQDKDVLKLRRRNPAAALLHVLAISWCSDHTSDGRIDEDTLLYVLGADEQDVADLVASGMLQPDPDGGEGMYVLRSYLKYQNSAEQIEQAKTKATERQRRKRERDADKTVTDTDKKPVTPMTEERPTPVTPMSRRDKEPVTPMSFNQEPRTNNEEIISPPTPSHEGAADDGFDEESFKKFEAAYPKHANQQRTLDAWRETLTAGADPATLVGAAKVYAKAMRDEGKPLRYIPTPANWLRSGQWREWADLIPSTAPPTEAWIQRHLLEHVPEDQQLPARQRFMTLVGSHMPWKCAVERTFEDLDITTGKEPA